jgi:hypothetical protein
MTPYAAPRTVSDAHLTMLDLRGLRLGSFRFVDFPNATHVRLADNDIHEITVSEEKRKLRFVDLRANDFVTRVETAGGRAETDAEARLGEALAELRGRQEAVVLTGALDDPAPLAREVPEGDLQALLYRLPFELHMEGTKIHRIIPHERGQAVLFHTGLASHFIATAQSHGRTAWFQDVELQGAEFAEDVQIEGQAELAAGQQVCMLFAHREKMGLHLRLLKVLVLPGCKDGDLQIICRGAYNLQSLDLSDNRLTTLAPFAKVGGPSGAMEQLAQLDVTRADGRWPKEELGFLRALPGLKDLHIGVHAELSADTVLERFRGLEWIDGMPNIIRPTPAQHFARRRLAEKGMVRREEGLLDSDSTVFFEPREDTFVLRDGAFVPQDEDIAQFASLLPARQVRPNGALDFRNESCNDGRNVELSQSMRCNCLSIAPTVERVFGKDLTDSERCSYHAEHHDVLKLEYAGLGTAIAQTAFQQLQLSWQYIRQTDFSTGGTIGSFAYVLGNAFLRFVSFIDVYDCHFSPLAWSLWLLICTLGPILCLSGVRWQIPWHYFIGIKNAGRSTLGMTVVWAGIILAFAAFVGVFCVLEVVISGTVNAFTVTVVSVIAAVLALGVCLIYDRVICRFVQQNEFEEIDLAKQKVFMFFVMVLQVPMLTHLLGFTAEYGPWTFLGLFGFCAAIGLAVMYAVSFWTLIDVDLQQHPLLGGKAEPLENEFDRMYHTEVQYMRAPARHLYADYTYLGRYTEIFDLGHRFFLSIPNLGGDLRDEFTFLYLISATIEIMYCYIWWPAYSVMDSVSRLLAGFGHFFVALDPLLVILTGKQGNRLAIVGWVFSILGVLAILLRSKVEAWIENREAKKRTGTTDSRDS